MLNTVGCNELSQKGVRHGVRLFHLFERGNSRELNSGFVSVLTPEYVIKSSF